MDLIYSVRHVTNFGYEPPVRESIMEVRVQPRNEAHQRCLRFSLDVSPNANIMCYRDFREIRFTILIFRDARRG